MKKFLLICLSSTIVLLGACSTESSNAESPKTTEEVTESISSKDTIVEESSSQEVAVEESSSEDSLFVEEGPLTEVGQHTFSETNGYITLEKIKSINETFELTEGLLITVNDIKLLRTDEPTEDFAHTLGYIGVKPSETMYTLQIDTIVENTNDYGFRGARFNRMVDSQGFQNDKNITSVYEDEIVGNAKRNDLFSVFVLNNNDLTDFTIYTNHLHTTSDGYTIDTPGIELSFE